MDVKIVTRGAIGRCPKQSLLPVHYRPDGTCRCNERDAARRELAAARAQLHAAKQAFHAAQERWKIIT